MQASALVCKLVNGGFKAVAGETASSMLALAQEVKLSGLIDDQPVAKWWVMRDDKAMSKGTIAVKPQPKGKSKK